MPPLDCCESPALDTERHLVHRGERDLYLKRCRCGAWWVHEQEDIWMGSGDDDDVIYDTLARVTDDEADALSKADDLSTFSLPARPAVQRRGRLDGELADWIPSDLLDSR